MYIRIITSATKSNKRTKKTVNKSNKSKKVVKKPTKKLTKRPSKRILKKDTTKGIKPSKKSPKSRNKQVNKRFNIRPSTGYPRQDMSLPTLESLLDEGYNRVTFVAHSRACKFCKKLNGKTWTLDRFITNLYYSAPLFEHSHVNAVSSVRVWDINGELEDVYVDYTGAIN